MHGTDRRTVDRVQHLMRPPREQWQILPQTINKAVYQIAERCTYCCDWFGNLDGRLVAFPHCVSAHDLHLEVCHDQTISHHPAWPPHPQAWFVVLEHMHDTPLHFPLQQHNAPPRGKRNGRWSAADCGHLMTKMRGNLANAKVSAQQQCMYMKASSEEI